MAHPDAAKVRSLPLYPGAEPCVRSGYCCKKAACGFGKYDEARGQCTYLETANGEYRCGIYEQITDRPVGDWEMSPAFGAGCCSPLNSEHRRLMRERQGAGGAAGPVR